MKRLISALILCLLLFAALVEAQQTSDESNPDSSPPPAPSLPTIPGERLLYWHEGKHEIVDRPILSADRIVITLPDTEKSVDVLQAQDLKDNRVSFLGLGLRDIAGIFPREYGPAFVEPIFRGQPPGRILILNDDIRVTNGVFRPGSFPYLSMFAPTFVSTVETVQGPNSALYGSGALAGLVQVLPATRDMYLGRFDVNASLLGRFDTTEEDASGGFLLTSHAGRFLGGAAGLEAINTRDRLPGGESAQHIHPMGIHRLAGSALMDGKPTDRITIRVCYQTTSMEDVPTFPPAESRDVTNPYRRDAVYLKVFSEQLSPYLSNGLGYVSFQQLTRSRARADYPLQGADTWSSTKAKTLGAGVTFRTKTGRYLELVYGADFYHDMAATERFVTGTPEGIEGESIAGAVVPNGSYRDEGGGYLSAWITPVSWLRLVPSFRVDAYYAKADGQDAALGKIDVNVSELEPSYALGANFRVSSGNSFFVSYSRAIRFPSLEELAAAGREDDLYIAPPKSPGSELLHQFELGWRLHYPFIKGQLATFVARDRHMIAAVAEPYDGIARVVSRPVASYDDVRDVDFYGVEAQMDFYLGINWNFGTAISYVQGTDLRVSRPADGVPPIFGNTHLRWTTDTEDLWLETRLRYAGKQGRLGLGDLQNSFVPPGGTPGWVTWDIVANFVVGHYVGVQISGLNLLDERYKTHGSGPLAPGRSLGTQLELKF